MNFIYIIFVYEKKIFNPFTILVVIYFLFVNMKKYNAYFEINIINIYIF